MCTSVEIGAVSIGMSKGQSYSRCTAIEPPESALHEVACFESGSLLLETLGMFASGAAQEADGVVEMNILVTGANGFVGQTLCPVLERAGFQIVRVVRISTRYEEISVGEVDGKTSWGRVLNTDIDSVIHLAAKVPLTEEETEAADSYHRVNTLGTARLARECAARGVRRFIFVSTVKVLGERCDEPFRADDPAVPSDAYAISKWEAEQSLRQISAETGMEIVILRPPLVYGPGVRGNFLRLLQMVDRRIPLPLGAIHNRRSLIYLGNLVDIIRLCLTHPDAAGKTFMVSDGEDVSTPDLIRRIRSALEHGGFLLPVPAGWMKRAGDFLGKRPAIDRLTGSLSVDSTPVQNELGWLPPYNMRAGIALTAQWYRQHKLETRS